MLRILYDCLLLIVAVLTALPRIEVKRRRGIGLRLRRTAEHKRRIVLHGHRRRQISVRLILRCACGGVETHHLLFEFHFGYEHFLKLLLLLLATAHCNEYDYEYDYKQQYRRGDRQPYYGIGLVAYHHLLPKRRLVEVGIDYDKRVRSRIAREVFYHYGYFGAAAREERERKVVFGNNVDRNERTRFGLSRYKAHNVADVVGEQLLGRNIGCAVLIENYRIAVARRIVAVEHIALVRSERVLEHGRGVVVDSEHELQRAVRLVATRHAELHGEHNAGRHSERSKSPRAVLGLGYGNIFGHGRGNRGYRRDNVALGGIEIVARVGVRKRGGNVLILAFVLDLRARHIGLALDEHIRRQIYGNTAHARNLFETVDLFEVVHKRQTYLKARTERRIVVFAAVVHGNGNDLLAEISFLGRDREYTVVIVAYFVSSEIVDLGCAALGRKEVRRRIYCNKANAQVGFGIALLIGRIGGVYIGHVIGYIERDRLEFVALVLGLYGRADYSHERIVLTVEYGRCGVDYFDDYLQRNSARRIVGVNVAASVEHAHVRRSGMIARVRRRRDRKAAESITVVVIERRRDGGEFK